MRTSIRNIAITTLSLSIMIAFAPLANSANITGYWRMEADTDGGGGYSIANEVTGNPLTGTAGSVEALTGGGVSFFPTLPNGGVANASGLNGSANISGTVTSYAALDSGSITVEFFARTNEGDARLILRQSGSTGLRIDQPSNMRVQYSTSAGQVTLGPGLLNMNADWDHLAFTYYQPSGTGQFYVNGSLVASNDGPDGLPLTWPAANLLVGNGMDGGGGLSGNDEPFLDELRIVDTRLHPFQFLTGNSAPIGTPEPSAFAIALAALAGLAMIRRRRRRERLTTFVENAV